MRSSHSFFEKAFTVISLLLYSGAFTYFIASTNPLYIGVQFLSWLTFFITIFLSLHQWRLTVYSLLKEKFILPLAGVVAISLIWSVLPISTTWYRVGTGGFSGSGILPFLQITLFGIYFATRYNLSQQFRLLAWMFGIAATCSVVVAVLLPSYGVMGRLGTVEDVLHSGSWRGVYIHKNTLGNTMVLAGMTFLTLSGDYRHSKPFLILGFILSVGLILLSTSKTALITLLMLLIFLSLYKSLRWKDSKLIPFAFFGIVITGCLITFMYTNFESIMISLGRDPTLTGRSTIWLATFENIKERFWFGYGYNTFWLAAKKELLIVWSTTGKLKPTHAHNGFLDLWLDLGFIGSFLFLIGLIVNYLRAILFIRLTKSEEALLPLLFLTYLTQINQSESYLVRENLLWLLYVSTSISLSLGIRGLLNYKTTLQTPESRAFSKVVNHDSIYN